MLLKASRLLLQTSDRFFTHHLNCACLHVYSATARTYKYESHTCIYGTHTFIFWKTSSNKLKSGAIQFTWVLELAWAKSGRLNWRHNVLRRTWITKNRKTYCERNMTKDWHWQASKLKNESRLVLLHIFGVWVINR